jgi:uncharacterized protein (TIRG00374 family)
MAQSKKSWLKLLPGLVVSGLSLAGLLYLVDVKRLAEALRLADYRMVALIFPTTLLWLLVRTVVWRTLLQEKATFSQVFFTLNEGYLLNNLLPFRLGEVGRAYLLSRKASIGSAEPLGFMQVFSTIIIERALDVAMAAGLLLCTLPFVVSEALGGRVDWALEAALAAGGLVVIGLGALYLLARYRVQAQAIFERSVSRWAFLRNFGARQLSAFLAGLAVLTDFRRFLRAVAWMAVNWAGAMLQYYLLLRAFFPDPTLLWVAFTLGVVALGVAAPSSPGAVGVMELAMVGALSAFGLDRSSALAAALVAHIANILITGLLGVYALARDGLTLSGLYRQVQRLTPDTTPTS